VAALVPLLLAVAPAAASAEDVHKCVVDGQVSYQATPCFGVDKVLHLQGGPEDDQVAAARERAAKEKARAREGAASAGVVASTPAAPAAAAAASAPARPRVVNPGV
jgi:hypothetical protein